ncbi:MAG: hypothetical protein R6V49_02545 [Bacteroidales bacterium]
MKLFFRIASMILLLINGLGAFYGGLKLIIDPSGGGLQLPLSYLERSPFSDYLIPGIILLSVNGILSFVAMVLLLLNHRRYPLFLMIQGVLLAGWISIQMLLLWMFYAPLHLPFLLIGLFLLIAGISLKRRDKVNNQ